MKVIQFVDKKKFNLLTGVHQINIGQPMIIIPFTISTDINVGRVNLTMGPAVN